LPARWNPRLRSDHPYTPLNADVLVVEPNDDQRTLLAGLLRRDGYTVRTVPTVALGQRVLEQRYPELVISDAEVSALDHAALAYRHFVESLGRERVPVILVSVLPRLPAIARAIGTPYFLAKPFAIENLLQLIGRALSEGLAPHPHAS
jgi:DNA-binding NtrC family response regulator